MKKTNNDDNVIKSLFTQLAREEHISPVRVTNVIKGPSKNISQSDKTFLKRYKRQFDEKKKVYDVSYKFPDIKNFNIGDNKADCVRLGEFGRLVPVKYSSIGILSREVRGYLANGVYTDIDMVNCHPVIIKKVLKDNGFDTSTLIDDYIFNRETYLKENNLTKQDFLVHLYDGCKQDIHPVVEPLWKAIYGLNGLSRKILNDETTDEFKTKFKNSRYSNKLGKFFALYIQNIESSLLGHCLYFFEKQYPELPVDVLMHDGFFVRCTDIAKIDATFEGLQAYILEKTGYPMKFKAKMHDMSLIHILDKHDDNYKYDVWKEKMEQNLFRVREGGAFYIEDDKYFERFNTSGEMKKKLSEDNTFSNMIEDGIGEDKDFVSFIDMWLRDDTKRQFRKFDFLPNNDEGSDIYNLWRGFKNDKVPVSEQFEANCASLTKYFQHMATNGDGYREDFRDFLMDYIAHIIQYPQYKKGIHLILYSQMEGSGKGTFVELIKKAIGEEYVLANTRPEYVLDRFNDVLSGKLVVNMDDVEKHELDKRGGALRSLLTQSTLTLETKGVPARTEASFHNTISTTNKPNIQYTGSSDRRNIVCEPVNKLSDELAIALYKLMDESPQDIYHFFKQRRINHIKMNDWQFYKKQFEDLSAYQDMRENCIPLAYKWLSFAMQNDVFSEHLFYKNNKVLDDYCSYLRVEKIDRSSENKFWKQLAEVNGIENGRARTMARQVWSKKFTKDTVIEWLKEKKYFIDDEDDDTVEVPVTSIYNGTGNEDTLEVNVI